MISRLGRLLDFLRQASYFSPHGSRLRRSGPTVGMNPYVPNGKKEGSPASHGSALPALAPEEQRWLVAALGFALLTDLAHLLTWPLLPVDETRYLSVAWEMWLRHEWLVPHLNGALYTDKPPLLFWLVHLGWAVAGVNDVWPRAVCGLCGPAWSCSTSC